MAHSFKFSILQASPDRRRGERVNVGIVVFLKDRIDVRFPEIRKLKALTGHAWDEIAQAYSNQIASADTADLDAVEVLGGMAFVSDVFTPSDIGVMNLKSVSEYEDRL